MAQTSIHFQAVKGGSEAHNKRLKKLDYVHHDRTPLNEYWESDTQEARLAYVTANAKAKTGRKMQAKATPIREAVVVIEDGTTMDDLRKLSDRLQERFGIHVFQIAIHRDEGYRKGKDALKLNLHAHLVADWTDHDTGKSLKLNRNDMAEMQTICAQVLGMERGVSSDKQHLSAIQYKEAKAKAEAEKAQLEAREAEATTAKAKEEAKEAEARTRKAEARAVNGLLVGGTKKLGNVLGIGAEAKQLKELPQKLEEAREEGRKLGVKQAKREIFDASSMTIDDKDYIDQMTTAEFGRGIKDILDEDKDELKKLQIIKDMSKDILTYDKAAEALKNRYANMDFYPTDRAGHYAGSSDAFEYQKQIFDPLCEAQGAHKVATTANAVGRRNIVAQGIIVAAIRFFDSAHLERLAKALKAMAECFNLDRWNRLHQETEQSRSVEHKQEQRQGRGYHF